MEYIDWMSVLIEELAFNGLEGCTLKELWNTLEKMRTFTKLDTNDDKVRKYVINAISHHSALQFYKLLSESCCKSDNRKKFLINDKDKKVRGFCTNYEDRRNISENIRENKEELSESVHIIVRQDIRESVLCSRWCVSSALSDNIYALLEYIALFREEGVRIIGDEPSLKHLLQAPSKAVFYQVELLELSNVVTKQDFLMKNCGRAKIVFHAKFKSSISQSISVSKSTTLEIDLIKNLLALLDSRKPDKCVGIEECRVVLGINQKMLKRLITSLIRRGDIEKVKITNGSITQSANEVCIKGNDVMDDLDESVVTVDDVDDDEVSSISSDNETSNDVQIYHLRLLTDKDTAFEKELLEREARRRTLLLSGNRKEQFCVYPDKPSIFSALAVLEAAGPLGLTPRQYAEALHLNYYNMRTLKYRIRSFSDVAYVMDPACGDDRRYVLKHCMSKVPFETHEQRYDRRRKLICDIVNEYKIIYANRVKLEVIEREKRVGINTTIDRKTIVNLIDGLVKEGKLFYVKNEKNEMNTALAVSCEAFAENSAEYVSFIRATKNKSLKEVLSLNPRNSLENDEKISEKSSSAQKYIPGKSKDNAPIPSVYGYVHKYQRCVILHKFLFYLLYDYKGDVSKAPKFYEGCGDWRTFVPPPPARPNNIISIGDLLYCMPLSIYVSLVKITKNVAELMERVGNPETAHQLLCKLPEHLKYSLIRQRRCLFQIEDSLKVLSAMTLITFVKNRFKCTQKQNVLLYLHRKVSFVNTLPGSDKRLQYELNTSDDLELMWSDVIEVALNDSRYSATFRNSSRPNRNELRARLNENCKMSSIENVQDPKPILGDGQGPLGLDSCLFIWLPINWHLCYQHGKTLKNFKKLFPNQNVSAPALSSPLVRSYAHGSYLPYFRTSYATMNHIAPLINIDLAPPFNSFHWKLSRRILRKVKNERLRNQILIKQRSYQKRCSWNEHEIRQLYLLKAIADFLSIRIERYGVSSSSDSIRLSELLHSFGKTINLAESKSESQIRRRCKKEDVISTAQSLHLQMSMDDEFCSYRDHLRNSKVKRSIYSICKRFTSHFSSRFISFIQTKRLNPSSHPSSVQLSSAENLEEKFEIVRKNKNVMEKQNYTKEDIIENVLETLIKSHILTNNEMRSKFSPLSYYIFSKYSNFLLADVIDRLQNVKHIIAQVKRQDIKNDSVLFIPFGKFYHVSSRFDNSLGNKYYPSWILHAFSADQLLHGWTLRINTFESGHVEAISMFKALIDGRCLLSLCDMEKFDRDFRCSISTSDLFASSMPQQSREPCQIPCQLDGIDDCDNDLSKVELLERLRSLEIHNVTVKEGGKMEKVSIEALLKDEKPVPEKLYNMLIALSKAAPEMGTALISPGSLISHTLSFDSSKAGGSKEKMKADVISRKRHKNDDDAEKKKSGKCLKIESTVDEHPTEAVSSKSSEKLLDEDAPSSSGLEYIYEEKKASSTLKFMAEQCTESILEHKCDLISNDDCFTLSVTDNTALCHSPESERDENSLENVSECFDDSSLSKCISYESSLDIMSNTNELKSKSAHCTNEQSLEFLSPYNISLISDDIRKCSQTDSNDKEYVEDEDTLQTVENTGTVIDNVNMNGAEIHSALCNLEHTGTSLALHDDVSVHPFECKENATCQCNDHSLSETSDENSSCEKSMISKYLETSENVFDVIDLSKNDGRSAESEKQVFNESTTRVSNECGERSVNELVVISTLNKNSLTSNRQNEEENDNESSINQNPPYSSDSFPINESSMISTFSQPFGNLSVRDYPNDKKIVLMSEKGFPNVMQILSRDTNLESSCHISVDYTVDELEFLLGQLLDTIELIFLMLDESTALVDCCIASVTYLEDGTLLIDRHECDDDLSSHGDKVSLCHVSSPLNFEHHKHNAMLNKDEKQYLKRRLDDENVETLSKRYCLEEESSGGVFSKTYDESYRGDVSASKLRSHIVERTVCDDTLRNQETVSNGNVTTAYKRKRKIIPAFKSDTNVHKRPKVSATSTHSCGHCRSIREKNRKKSFISIKKSFEVKIRNKYKFLKRVFLSNRKNSVHCETSHKLTKLETVDYDKTLAHTDTVKKERHYKRQAKIRRCTPAENWNLKNPRMFYVLTSDNRLVVYRKLSLQKCQQVKLIDNILSGKVDSIRELRFENECIRILIHDQNLVFETSYYTSEKMSADELFRWDVRMSIENMLLTLTGSFETCDFSAAEKVYKFLPKSTFFKTALNQEELRKKTVALLQNKIDAESFTDFLIQYCSDGYRVNDYNSYREFLIVRQSTPGGLITSDHRESDVDDTKENVNNFENEHIFRNDEDVFFNDSLSGYGISSALTAKRNDELISQYLDIKNFENLSSAAPCIIDDEEIFNYNSECDPFLQSRKEDSAKAVRCVLCKRSYDTIDQLEKHLRSLHREYSKNFKRNLVRSLNGKGTKIKTLSKCPYIDNNDKSVYTMHVPGIPLTITAPALSQSLSPSDVILSLQVYIQEPSDDEFEVLNETEREICERVKSAGPVGLNRKDLLPYETCDLDKLVDRNVLLLVGFEEYRWVSIEYADLWCVKYPKKLTDLEMNCLVHDDIHKTTTDYQESICTLDDQTCTCNFSEDFVMFVPKPWRNLNGEINVPVLQMFLEFVLLSVCHKPGITALQLQSWYLKDFLCTVFILDLLYILEKLNCLYSRNISYKKNVNLFTKREDLSLKECIDIRIEKFWFPDVFCFEKFNCMFPDFNPNNEKLFLPHKLNL